MPDKNQISPEDVTSQLDLVGLVKRDELSASLTKIMEEHQDIGAYISVLISRLDDLRMSIADGEILTSDRARFDQEMIEIMGILHTDYPTYEKACEDLKKESLKFMANEASIPPDDPSKN